MTDFNQKKYPPINKLRAFILERELVLGYSHKDLADIAHINYGYMRKLLSRVDPWEWPSDVRLNVCNALGIKTKLIIEDGCDSQEI